MHRRALIEGGPDPWAARGASAEPMVVPCEEHGIVDIPLEQILDSTGRLRTDPEIEQRDYFAVSLKDGKLTLRARGHVGYIPLNDRIVIYIRPRVPVRNLSHIAAISGYPPTVLTSLRQYARGEEWDKSLIDLYAGAFVTDLEGLIASGVLLDYQRREEVSSFPRGRVLVHRTIQNLTSREIYHAAHVTWAERSADNNCNRCLKYALWALAQSYISNPSREKHTKKLRRRINALYAAFDSVMLDLDSRFLEDPLVRGSQSLPPLRSYYRDALNIALAIIERRGVLVESMKGDLRLASVVLDMNSVFERYVRRVLMLHAAENSWEAQVLDGNKHPATKLLFNQLPSPQATPDIIVREREGQTWLVCEVKNIPVQDLFSDREAIEQAVTYAVSYATRQTLLIHPCAANQRAGIRKLGDIGDIAVYQYRFDLSADDLLTENSRFGQAIESLLLRVCGHL